CPSPRAPRAPRRVRRGARDDIPRERTGEAGGNGSGIRYPSRAMRGMDRLLELQEIDTAIDRAQARRSALESGGEEAAARVEADAAEVALGELRLKSDEIGRTQQKLEHEIDSLTQKAAAEDR